MKDYIKCDEMRSDVGCLPTNVISGSPSEPKVHFWGLHIKKKCVFSNEQQISSWFESVHIIAGDCEEGMDGGTK